MDMLNSFMQQVLRTPPRQNRGVGAPPALERRRVPRSPGRRGNRYVDANRRGRYRAATTARAEAAGEAARLNDGTWLRRRVERGGGAARRLTRHPASMFAVRGGWAGGLDQSAGLLLNDMAAALGQREAVASPPPAPVERLSAEEELDVGLAVAAGVPHVDGECAICQEHTRACEGNTTTLPCGHVFHSACIGEWFAQGRSVRSCPECRADAVPELRSWGRAECVCHEGGGEPGVARRLALGPAAVPFVELADGSVVVE